LTQSAQGGGASFAATASDFVKAAPRGMLIAVAVAFIFLNGLGVWQLYRLHWKEGLIADLARTEAMPAVAVDTVLDQPKPSWRSVTLPPCKIDPKHLINMHSEVDGVPGFRVLTACPLSGGQNLLVDLGFSVDRLSLAGPVDIEPVGRLRPADKSSTFSPVNTPASGEWYTRSVPEVSRAWHVDVRADYFLVLDVAASKLNMPGLQQGPVTAPLPNRHFEYALTWFSLAWIMMGIFFAFVRQKQTHNG
jgi:surfeit locus 1 family protein